MAAKNRVKRNVEIFRSCMYLPFGRNDLSPGTPPLRAAPKYFNMNNLKQHPLSAAFPSMSESEIQALANDISANGQREPGVIFEDMVIDGWHRYQACQIAGVEFDSRPLAKFDDPVLFVKSRNLHRRHLTASQRAAAVVACNDWHPSGYFNLDKGATIAPLKIATNAEMAKEADVSERTIQYTKTASKVGLISDVKEGKISAKKAHDQAKGETKQKPKPLGFEEEQKSPEISQNEAESAEFGPSDDEIALAEKSELDQLEYIKNLLNSDDDPLTRALSDIKRLNAKIESLTRERDGAVNKANECMRMVKSLQFKIKKLEGR